jgi:hypothetical protein
MCKIYPSVGTAPKAKLTCPPNRQKPPKTGHSLKICPLSIKPRRTLAPKFQVFFTYPGSSHHPTGHHPTGTSLRNGATHRNLEEIPNRMYILSKLLHALSPLPWRREKAGASQHATPLPKAKEQRGYLNPPAFRPSLHREVQTRPKASGLKKMGEQKRKGRGVSTRP